MGTNSEYFAKMEAQLKKWDADVDALVAEGEKANDKARAAYHDRIKELRADREAAQKTYQEIRAAGESAGAQMQEGMTVAWQTMQKALERCHRISGNNKTAGGRCNCAYPAFLLRVLS